VIPTVATKVNSATATEPGSSGAIGNKNISLIATRSQVAGSSSQVGDTDKAAAKKQAKRKPNKRMAKIRKQVHPAHCGAVIQRDLMCARNQLEFDLSLQPLPSLSHHTDTEKQYTDQKGGGFRQPLPINSVELANG